MPACAYDGPMKRTPAASAVPTAPTAFALRAALRKVATPEQAQKTRGFFKIGPGEYAAGDMFIGVKQADLRKAAKEHVRMPLTEVQALLNSKIHEERHAALLILVARFEAGGPKAKQEIFEFYMGNLRCVNNWDLTDASAAPIVGAWLVDKDRAPLHALAKSKNLWERRIAVTATHAFVKAGESKDTFALAELLLKDKHELIHKAAGWMLREVGKHLGDDVLRVFLKWHAKEMPLAMLRAAIDGLPAEEKARWLAMNSGEKVG